MYLGMKPVADDEPGGSNDLYEIQHYNIAQPRFHSTPTARVNHNISITVNTSGDAEKRPSTLYLSDVLTATYNFRLITRL